VENTTDEDWNQVSLGLVSGRPISFRMDLYQPLYVPRPMVEPELFASLRPPAYSGDMEALKSAPRQMNGTADRQMLNAPAAAAPGGAGRAKGGGRFGGGMEKAAPAPEESLDLARGIASAAVATELGEYFQYQIEQPVTLPRQKSALLPIVNAP